MWLVRKTKVARRMRARKMVGRESLIKPDCLGVKERSVMVTGIG